MGFLKPKAPDAPAPMPVAPAAEDPAVNKAKEAAAAEEQRRARGRAATVFTLGSGAKDKLTTSAAQLLAG